MSFSPKKPPEWAAFLLNPAVLYLVIFSNGDISPQNTFKTGINAP